MLAFTKGYNVVLTSDSPVVRGGTVHFVVTLYDDDGTLASGKFRYNWEDNTQRRHMASVSTFESSGKVKNTLILLVSMNRSHP